MGKEWVGRCHKLSPDTGHGGPPPQTINQPGASIWLLGTAELDPSLLMFDKRQVSSSAILRLSLA